MNRPQLLRQIGSVTFLIGLGFFFQALADVFLARHLTSAEYGYFTLIFRDAANIIAMLILMGIDSPLIRHINASTLPSLSWRNFSRTMLLMFTVAGVALVAIVKLIYGISAIDFVMLLVLVVLMATITLRGTFLRISGSVATAQLTLQLWRMTFPFLVLVIFWWGMFTATYLAGGLVISAAISVLFSHVLLRNIGEGETPIHHRKLFAEGWLFFGLSSSSLAMIKVERFFLGGIGSLSEVGSYYAVSLAVITVYSIAASSSSYVLLPHFAQGGAVKMKRNLFRLCTVGAVIGAGYLIAGKQLIHLLFKGKYDDFAFLIPYFVATGILQLLYLLPSTFIGGKADTKTLRQFLVFGIVALGINIGLCILLIPLYGVTGAAISTLCAWGFRLLNGLWFARAILIKERK